jgi:CHASE3 domain sensor protein
MSVVILLLVTGLLTLWSTMRLQADIENGTKHRTRLEQYLALQFALLQAENTELAYARSGDANLLSAFDAAEHEAMTLRYQMRIGPNNNEQRIEELGQLTEEEIELLHRSVHLRAENGSAITQRELEEKARAASMERIQPTLEKLCTEERAQIDDTIVAAGRGFIRTMWNTIVLVTVSWLLVGLATVVIVRDSRRRADAERESAVAHEKTALWAHELERTTGEIGFINEFTEAMGVCFAQKEAYRVIVAYLGRLWPQAQGKLALINNSRNLVETAVSWNPPLENEHPYHPNDCYALRSGRTYAREIGSPKLPCQHAAEREGRNSLCVPLTAQGETLGIMHLDFGVSRWDENQLKLVANLVERSAIKLANINLSEKLL